MKPVLVIAGTSLLSTVLVLLAGSRMNDAKQHADAALSRASLVGSQLGELEALQRQPSMMSRGRQGDQALVSRLNAACTIAGVPRQAITAVAPGAESDLDPARNLRGQDASVTLDGVTLSQLGRFLDAWRATEPAWRVTGLQITPQSQGRRDGATTPLRIQLALRTTFLTQENPR